MTEHRLTPADDGKSLSVDAEDVVVLELPEQAVTGYQWTVEASGAAVVRERLSEGADPGAPGAGHTRVFEVRPGPGRTRVTATKARSWETAPLERLAVNLERR